LDLIKNTKINGISRTHRRNKKKKAYKLLTVKLQGKKSFEATRCISDYIIKVGTS
jgi:hypothetical protein